MATVTTHQRTHLRMNEWMRDASYAIQQSDEPEIVVDMSSVERVCSEDLNELIRLHLDLKMQGRKLVLENALDHVAQVFLITRLDRVLELRQQPLAGSHMPAF